MTGAPERIWAWQGTDPLTDKKWDAGEWYTKDIGLDGDEVEYVRAALYDDLLQNVEIATNALEDIMVDPTWGLEHETYMRCRVALAQLKKDL